MSGRVREQNHSLYLPSSFYVPRLRHSLTECDATLSCQEGGGSFRGGWRKLQGHDPRELKANADDLETLQLSGFFGFGDMRTFTGEDWHGH